MIQPIQIAPNGPTFSRILAGVWKWGVWGHKLDTQAGLSLIEASIDAGVTTFDHADIYGNYTNEEEFGDALKLQPSLRDKMQIVTKCGIRMVCENRPEHKVKTYDTSQAHIVASVENSLRMLHVDKIDLLLIHRPDPLMQVDEVAEAFESLRKAGKVAYFGVSNFTPRQFDLLHHVFPLVTNQVQASLVHMQPLYDGTFDQCMLHGIAPMAWSPLGSGKVFVERTDPAVKRIRALGEELGETYGCSLDQLLLAWLMRHPARVLPILGTARPDRIRDAAKATGIELSRTDWFRLWEASTGTEVP
ncbi:MAG: aldo/keto reductase [Bacteroidota bacterium]